MTAREGQEFDGQAWEDAINEAIAIYRAAGLDLIADQLCKSINSPQYVIETILNPRGPYNFSLADPSASRRLGESLRKIEELGQAAVRRS